MNIVKTAVNRPIATIMFIVALLLMGVLAFMQINVDLLPKISLPSLIVVTQFPGASPQEVEEKVSIPLEEVLNTTEGIKSITSKTEEELSLIQLEFDWGTDMNFASMKVKEKLNSAKLPQDVKDPYVWRWNPADQPIFRYDISGKMSLDKLRDHVEHNIKPRLERLGGVGSVTIIGGLEREIKIEVDQKKLDAYYITIMHVIHALKKENLNSQGGRIEEGRRELLIRTVGEFKNISDLDKIIVALRGDKVPIYLRDVAVIKDTFAEQRTYSRLNGYESVGILIKKESDANTLKVIKNVKEELSRLQKEYPEGMTYAISQDDSKFIQESQDMVIHDIQFGGMLAVLVIFVFLRNIRSTVVIALAIPISVIATFIGMHALGITRNVLSLAGLSLGVGMLVDDSTVIVENIYRFLGRGYKPSDATVSGAVEVSSSVISSTLTSLAVFLPITFMSGLASQLFSDLAWTVIFSLFFSMIVSFTITPMLASRILKPEGEKSESPSILSKLFNNLFDKPLKAIGNIIVNTYGFLLGLLMGYWVKRLVIVGIVMSACLISLLFLPGRIFLPSGNVREVAVKVKMPLGSSIQTTDTIVRQIESIVLKDLEKRRSELEKVREKERGKKVELEKDTIASEVKPEDAEINIQLNMYKEKELTVVDTIVDDWRKGVSKIPGAEITVNKISKVTRAGQVGTPIDIRVGGTEIEKIEDVAGQISGGMKEKGIDAVFDVSTSIAQGAPEIQVELDRDKISRLGLNTRDIALLIAANVHGVVSTTLGQGDKEVDIRVSSAGIDKKSISDFEKLSILSPTGRKFFLRDVAKIYMGRGKVKIERQDLHRIVSVTSNVKLEYSLSEVIEDIQKKVIGAIDYPRDLITFKGTAKDMEESFLQLGIALIISVILVYMIIAAQFESFLNPFIIMFTLPLSFIGISLGLNVANEKMSIAAMVGVILLGGIVVRNGIILIEYISILRKRGIDRDEAIMQACKLRIRPIFITALATILGMTPMALGIGPGAELYSAMAVVVIFGLAFSTMFTLFIIPTIYTLFDDLKDYSGAIALRVQQLLFPFKDKIEGL
ncbi:MAG: efflux RND transporter permease subunit [Nitrospirota bacterium]